jgi:hypothetical protein
VELVGLAQLLAFWEDMPPIVDEGLHRYGETSPDPCAASDPDLADRLHHLVIDWQLPRPVNMHELAEAFVTSEISAASGASRRSVGLRLDAARALFLDGRLPRSRRLLQSGLLDWTKLSTVIRATQDLDDDVCRRVEARVIPDDDLAAAAVEPLDVREDPTRPGANLPAITRMTNPALERELRAAIVAIDAASAAERAAAARDRREVHATALDDSMARLEIEAGQDAVAAVMNDLDAAVASAKATGDPRTADQIRADHAIRRLTRGAYGAATTEREATAVSATTGSVCSARTAAPDGVSEPNAPPALAVSLTMSLSTWLSLADEPAVLDRHGPVPAALARQIARDAARDHPTTTTWRCVITDDGHRTVLGVGDPIRTPRHDPPPRLARLVTTMHPQCTFPGCSVRARRCELDHRVPFDHADPASRGVTCSCNVHPLCGAHHRLKTARLITPSPIRADDPSTVLGTLVWSTVTGRSYRHDPATTTARACRPRRRRVR